MNSTQQSMILKQNDWVVTQKETIDELSKQRWLRTNKWRWRQEQPNRPSRPSWLTEDRAMSRHVSPNTRWWWSHPQHNTKIKSWISMWIVSCITNCFPCADLLRMMFMFFCPSTHTTHFCLLAILGPFFKLKELGKILFSQF